MIATKFTYGGRKKVAGKMVQFLKNRKWCKLCQSGTFSFRVFDQQLLTLGLQSTFLGLDLWRKRLQMKLLRIQTAIVRPSLYA
uniref:Uncharacterized protein n=1 Tax=Pyxicephalus adspersus TaxID=30357 RepID=A0AAV3AKV2_PYXAD|nr:TPA: hypothetical protein GDO54_014518 [Pyxicephalus adspersus]